MKLTNKDKDYLISIGYRNEDLHIIEFTIKRMRYEMFFTKYASISISESPKIKLNQKQVIGFLGRETFLSGAGRATFHNTAVRTSDSLPNVSIYFEKRQF